MHLNFSKLSSLQHEGTDKVLAKLGPYDVTVQRYLRGWQPWIRVTIDGLVMHDSDAGPEDRHAYNILLESAMAERSNQQDTKRAYLNSVCMDLYAD
jgi:hypothetical protein